MNAQIHNRRYLHEQHSTIETVHETTPPPPPRVILYNTDQITDRAIVRLYVVRQTIIATRLTISSSSLQRLVYIARIHNSTRYEYIYMSLHFMRKE